MNQYQECKICCEKWDMGASCHVERGRQREVGHQREERAMGQVGNHGIFKS